MKLFVHTLKAVRAGHPVDRLFVVSSQEKDRKGVVWFTAWKCTILPNGMIRHPNTTKLLTPSQLVKFKPVPTDANTPTAVFKYDSFYKEWNAKTIGFHVQEHINKLDGIMPAVPPSTQQDFDSMSPATQKLVYKSKKALPKAEVLKLKPGTWVIVKWEDAPDQVLLLTNKPDRTDVCLDVVDVTSGSAPRPQFDQVIGTRGTVTPPPLRDLPPAKWTGTR